MKRFAGLFFLLALLVLTSCSTTEPLSLVTVPEKKTETYIQGSRIFAAKSDGDVQMIVGINEYTGKKVGFTISIASTDDSTFNFEDSFISIYGGNKDKKKWDLLKTWSSTAAVRSSKAKASTAVIATGIIGTLAVIDSILNADEYYTDVSYVGGYHYSPYHGHYDHSSGVYIESNDPFFTALSAIEATVAVGQLSSIYEDEYNSKLLSCPVKTPVSSVSGEVTFSSLPKYADYKLVFNNGKQKIEFFFSRSDREEILHPWRDKDSDLIALNYSFTPSMGRHNVSFNFLPPELFGVYTGLSIYQKYMDTPIYRGIGLNAGINFKAADYTWLQAGIDISDLTSDAEFADMLATAGIEFSINGVSLYGGAIYSLMEDRWFAELGVGTAF